MRRIRIAWMTIYDPSSRKYRDDLERVPGAVRPQVQHLAILLIGSDDRMHHRVLDVIIADFVLLA